MKYSFFVFLFLVVFCFSSLAKGQDNSNRFKTPDLAAILPLLDAGSPEALEGVLRGVVLRSIPNPLYEASPGWGEQKRVVNGLKWKKEGIFLKPVVQKGERNHGNWRKIKVEAITPENTLVLDIRHVDFPEPGKMVFGVFLSFDARAYYLQHNWNSGVRIYAGSVRARFRTNVTIKFEVSADLVSGKALLPDAVFRFRILEAGLSYENLVFEHVPGIGGTAANLIGQAAHQGINQWHPSLERDLLERATNSLLRAGNSREVRVSLSKVLNKAFGWK